MRHAGFVLVGGKSSRMGRDKALLAWNGATLAQHAARIVAEVCGSTALVGDPVRDGSLGYPVFADRFPGCGPIGGGAAPLWVSPPPSAPRYRRRTPREEPRAPRVRGARDA